MQLPENRWCTVTRSARAVQITLAGPFSPGNSAAAATYSKDRLRWEVEPGPRISFEIEHALHRMNKDLEWLPLDMAQCPVKASVTPDAADDGVTTIQFNFSLPETTFFFKYRVLLMEEQRLDQYSPTSGRTSNPIYASRYFDEIEF